MKLRNELYDDRINSFVIFSLLVSPGERVSQQCYNNLLGGMPITENIWQLKLAHQISSRDGQCFDGKSKMPQDSGVGECLPTDKLLRVTAF